MTTKPIQAIQSRRPSRQQAFEFFAFCIFLVQTWAIYSLLREVPSLLLRLDMWDFIGAGAYTFAFALIESLGLFVLFYALAVLLPAPILKDEFIVRALLIFFTVNYLALVFIVEPDQVLAWAAGLVGFGGLGYFVVKYQRIRTAIADGVDRLTVLASLYIIIDIVSLLIVIVRNLG